MQHSHTISLIILRCLMIESSQASFFSNSTKFMDAGCFQLFILIFVACCFSSYPWASVCKFSRNHIFKFPQTQKRVRLASNLHMPFKKRRESTLRQQRRLSSTYP